MVSYIFKIIVKNGKGRMALKKVVIIPSLSQYSTLPNLEKCRTKYRLTRVEWPGEML